MLFPRAIAGTSLKNSICPIILSLKTDKNNGKHRQTIENFTKNLYNGMWIVMRFSL